MEFAGEKFKRQDKRSIANDNSFMVDQIEGSS